jgi:hypothetical protein
MTQDEIIEMAKECGLVGMRPHLDGIYFEALEEFAKLVAQHEREACIEDIMWHVPRSGRDTPEYQRAMKMIERIRARGQA